jgi:uncharacterized protein (TIGR03435 family)
MRKNSVALLAAIAAALASVALPRAQAPQTNPSPEFEAASVKRSDPSAAGQRLGFAPGGRFSAVNVPLRQLIAAAYGTPQPLPSFLVLGGPDWLDKDRFDIVAKAAGDPQPGPNGPPPEMFLMMRTLLAERFKLMVHRETRPQPIYALVKARADGKLGERIHASTFDCSTLAAAARAGTPPPGPDAPFCGLRAGPGRMQGGSASMSMFATSLSRGVNRLVQDQTGLVGTFDFVMEYTPDQAPPPGTAFAPAGAPAPTDGPSIFAALQEQLGLKLQSTTAPVDVMVIDAAERPTEN